MKYPQRLLVSIFIVAVIIVFMIHYNTMPIFNGVILNPALPSLSTPRPREQHKITISRKSRKKILLYTALFGSIPWKDLPYGYDFTDFDNMPCPVNNCELTYDKTKINDSDIVVFHGRDLQSASDLRHLAKTKRNTNQVWLYFMHESPIYSYTKFPDYKDLFNWTASYRSSSDILVTYHYYKKLQVTDTPLKFNTNFAEGKKNLVTYVNSHCDKERMDFITELRKYIQVDVYGGCASKFSPQTRPCPRGEACRKIQQEYKFYLAIENSYCVDYITEKYWLNALETGLVPIVLGGGNYSNPRVAIPGSFVNMGDFKSLKQLADYIKYLDKNDSAYSEYHQWRYKYKLYNHNSQCLFCKAAHEHNVPRKTIDLEEFWGLQNCDLKKRVLNGFVEESKSNKTRLV